PPAGGVPQQHPPAGRVCLTGAQAEERQAGLHQYETGDRQREVHYDERGGGRQQVPEQYPQSAATLGFVSGSVVIFAQREYQPADDAGEVTPAYEAKVYDGDQEDLTRVHLQYERLGKRVAGIPEQRQQDDEQEQVRDSGDD